MRGVVLFALVFGGLSASTEQRAPVLPGVDVAVPFQPVSFRQGDHDQLVYELHVTNFQRVDVSLNVVRITGPRGPIAEYRDDDLRRRIVRPGMPPDDPSPHVVGPGLRAVINLWIAMDGPQSVPPTIRHFVDVTMVQAGRQIAVSVSGTASPDPMAAPVIGPPLGAGQWVTIYDPVLKGGHRTAIYTIDGRARIPGRFAIDFIELPPGGALLRDRAARPTEGNGFGADVLAVADGTIATAVDDAPDHQQPPIPLESASGNYIALDLGNRRVAFYEHLKSGSIRVKQGQRVRRGEVIAALGASGSTSIGPHLHFHVADADSLLGAEGMPFVFDRFTVLGDFASIDALVAGEPWRPAQLARPAVPSRPMPNSVISFR